MFILRLPSWTPTATSPAPRATAVGGSTRRPPIRAEKLADAEARATATVNTAHAGSDRVLALAASEADAFAYQLDARAAAPTLTDFRLFWETVASVMAGRPKLILDGSAGRPQRLILPRLPLEQAASLIGPTGQPPQGGKKSTELAQP